MCIDVILCNNVARCYRSPNIRQNTTTEADLDLNQTGFFVLLHQPNGREVYVNAEQVDYIGVPPDKAYGPGAGSLLMVYGIWVAVREKPNDVKHAIDVVLKQE